MPRTNHGLMQLCVAGWSALLIANGLAIGISRNAPVGYVLTGLGAVFALLLVLDLVCEADPPEDWERTLTRDPYLIGFENAVRPGDNLTAENLRALIPMAQERHAEMVGRGWEPGILAAKGLLDGYRAALAQAEAEAAPLSDEGPTGPTGPRIR